MSDPLDQEALDQLFLKARTHNSWLPRDVSDDVLHRLIDLMKMAPTSANCSPARIVFVKSAAAKARLIPLLNASNRAKSQAAPVNAVIGYDLNFYDHLPKLFPHTDARLWFTGNIAKIEETAFRNGSLQGAYLILAARSLGLDCGPMSGFDAAGVTREFFPETDIRANFLCNLGYGDTSALYSRSPRFTFDDVAQII